jgi:nucleoside-diphosphate-sugar epimerase
VHIEDISSAFLAALKAPREAVYNQAFNVGVTGENYQVKDLAGIVKKIMPECEIEYANKGGPDPRNYRVDFGKLERTLEDYEPKWNAKRGAEQLFSAFQKNGFTIDDFKGKKYIRLSQLKYLINEKYLDDTLRWAKKDSALIEDKA